MESKFRPRRDGGLSSKPSNNDISACERDGHDFWFYSHIFKVEESNEAIYRYLKSSTSSFPFPVFEVEKVEK
jgi:hypothetical protein